MIYVSTGGCKGVKPSIALDKFVQAGIYAVELSGGSHELGVERYLIESDLGVALKIHNYFPPPAEPFVINLASTDSSVFAKSIDHVRKALRLCSKLCINEYSVHAGFLLDPIPASLGGLLDKNVYIADRKIAIDTFCEAIFDLAK